MAQSVGAVALDIVMGKNTVTGVVKSAMSECQKVISDSSASMASKVGAVGNAMSGVGKALMPVSGAAIGAGVAIGKMSLGFEEAMAKVNTIADTTEVPLGDLEKQIIELSNQTGVSASEIADNVYNAISAGQKTGDAVNFVSNSTKLAKAGFADAGASLDVLTTILNSYGMEAEEVNRVSDILIQTQNKGKTTVGELSSYMGKVIPTANAYGVNLENVATNYAIMTAKGIATAESTTYMNSMFNELGKSSTGVAKQLKAISGKSFKELMDSGMSVGDVLMLLKDDCDKTGTQFSDLWSSAEAGKAALVLTQEGADGFNDMLGTMQNSTGSTETAFGKMETKGYTLQKAWNTLKNTAIDLGSALMQTLGPMIEKLSQKVADFSKWFNSLDEDTKQTIVKIGMFVAAAGPLLLVGGKLVGAISSIMNAGKVLKGGLVAIKGAIAGVSAPVLGVVAVIAVLVAAFVHLWKTNEDFRNKITAIWDGLKAKFDAFGQGIVDRLNALGFDFQNFGEVIKAVWDAICSVLAPIFEGAFAAVSAILGTTLDVLTGLFDFFAGLFTGNWEQCWNGIKGIFGGIWNGITGLFKANADMIKGLADAFLSWFGTSWNALWTSVKNFFSNIWNGIKNFFVNIVTGIKNTAVNIFTSMKNGISNTVSGIKNAIVNGFTAAINWIKALPGQAVQWGKDMIQGIINGIKAMIGKIGDAVKGVAEKIKSFLHFSVPDEGPLTDYETWMPDFMQGMAKGIKDNQHLVTDAVQGLTADMSVNPIITPPQLKNVSTGQNNGSTGGNNKLVELLTQMLTLMKQGQSENITVPVYLGADLFDEQTVKANSVRALRSGGRA